MTCEVMRIKCCHNDVLTFSVDTCAIFAVCWKALISVCSFRVDTMVNITRWWKPDNVSNSCDEWFHYNVNDGYLTIHKDGLYFLQAQVYKINTVLFNVSLIYFCLNNTENFDNSIFTAIFFGIFSLSN